MAWSKLKSLLKDANAGTREALDKASAQAIELARSDDAEGWFRQCGYVAGFV